MANDHAIKKENWVSNFFIVGRPKVNDYTFKLDEKSQKSSWIYNAMNLGVDAGEKYGTVYCSMMGGYSDERPNKLYVHGKNEDGGDDFSNRFEVEWDDRFDEDLLETIGDRCFITVGLEVTDKGNTFYKKFLSAYDAIAYAHEHLTEDMVVNVRGVLKYSMYQGNVQVNKEVQSIALSKADDPSKYYAHFTQSILIDEDSASLKNVDKDKGVMYVDARVLDYLKEYNGHEVKGNYPFHKQFEFELDLTNQALCKKVYDKLFKVKKNSITQITFDGELREGGATVKATLEDIPEDIKELLDAGVYTKEEALAKCSASGSREHRMIIVKPTIRLVGEEKTPVLQKFENKFTEDELDMSWVMDSDSDDQDEAPFDEDETSDSDSGDMDWLDAL